MSTSFNTEGVGTERQSEVFGAAHTVRWRNCRCKVRKYSADELHGFMHPDFRSDEPRWVDGKDYDRLSDALTKICDGNTMRVGGRAEWTLADVIQEHYKIAGNALEGK